MLLPSYDLAKTPEHTALYILQTTILNSSINALLTMPGAQPSNAIYFPEGAGYLLVKVLQTRCDNSEIESDVVLVKSLDDNKLYVRKTVELTECSATGIPNEIEFNLSFDLIPRVKEITKYVDPSGLENYWAICTEFCNGGDLRGLLNIYCEDKRSAMPEILIWKFVADFCKILNFLGENNVEHKDIWPQNIFLRYSEENLDDGLPDFVLGDFGWAVPLTEANRTEDMALFCCRLWEMCLGYPWDGRTCDIHKPSHLSLDLRLILKHLMVSSGDDILTLDFLVNSLLPFAEHIIGQLHNKVSVWRHLSHLPIISPADNLTTWPEKLESLVEDWQLVYVQQSPDGSGKLSIQGLHRTARNGKRDFSSFHRSSPSPVDLNLVYHFDAGQSNFPPVKMILNDQCGMTTSMAQQGRSNSEALMRKEVASLWEAMDVIEANLCHEAEIPSEAVDLTDDEDDELDEGTAENEIESLAELFGLTKEEKDWLAEVTAQDQAERLSQLEIFCETDVLSHKEKPSNEQSSSDTEALSNVVVSPRMSPFHEVVTQAQIRPAKVIADSSAVKKATGPPATVTESFSKRMFARAKKSAAAMPDGCPPPQEVGLPWLYMAKFDAIFLTASWVALAFCLMAQLFR